ncbi:MAG: hypothetical protein V5B33_10585 [Candidatus Accumulibacter sp. UW20]|jgi:transposase
MLFAGQGLSPAAISTRMKKPPEQVDVTPAQIDELLALAKPVFPAPQYARLSQILSTFVFVMQALQNTKLSLARFRQMVFGAPTESKRNLLKPLPQTDEIPAAADAAAPGETAPAEATPPKPPKPGHGRNSAAKYVDSQVIEVKLPGLKAGDPCPNCDQAKVYASPPRIVVKVVGQPPIDATIYRLETLRCRMCETTYVAPLP